MSVVGEIYETIAVDFGLRRRILNFRRNKVARERVNDFYTDCKYFNVKVAFCEYIRQVYLLHDSLG